ncbi:hypothetical protein JCM10213_003519 [Rhodosporidiobolus nylandii]
MSVAVSDQPCRITTLPKELLDEVLEHVAGFGDYYAVSTFHAWTRTCRPFVASGRRALFREPFRHSELSRDQERAQQLLTTLQESSYLAKLVRNLESLAHATLSHGSADPFGGNRHDKMLSLSNLAVKVGIFVRSPEHAKALGQALASHDQMRCLTFAFRPGVVEYRAVKYFLRSLPEQQRQLLFLSITLALPFRHTSPPKPLPFTAKQLELNALTLGGERMADWLPSNLSRLRTLAMSSTKRHSEPRIAPLFSRLAGNHLTSFTYRGRESSARLNDVDDYEREVQGTAFPLTAFSSFPRLRFLALRSGRLMSLDKLCLLATSSPSLRTLDLGDTFWTFTEDDFLLDEDKPEHTLSSGESALLDVLSTMRRLRIVHLGNLPIDEDIRPSLELEYVCRDRGIEVDWVGCYQGSESESSEEE